MFAIDSNIRKDFFQKSLSFIFPSPFMIPLHLISEITCKLISENSSNSLNRIMQHQTTLTKDHLTLYNYFSLFINSSIFHCLNYAPLKKHKIQNYNRNYYAFVKTKNKKKFHVDFTSFFEYFFRHQFSCWI